MLSTKVMEYFTKYPAYYNWTNEYLKYAVYS